MNSIKIRESRVYCSFFWSSLQNVFRRKIRSLTHVLHIGPALGSNWLCQVKPQDAVHYESTRIPTTLISFIPSHTIAPPVRNREYLSVKASIKSVRSFEIGSGQTAQPHLPTPALSPNDWGVTGLPSIDIHHIPIQTRPAAVNLCQVPSERARLLPKHVSRTALVGRGRAARYLVNSRHSYPNASINCRGADARGRMGAGGLGWL